MQKLELHDIYLKELDYLDQHVEPFCTSDSDSPKDFNATGHNFDMISQMVDNVTRTQAHRSSNYMNQSLNRTGYQSMNDYRENRNVYGGNKMNSTTRSENEHASSAHSIETTMFETIGSNSNNSSYRKRKLEQSVLVDRSNHRRQNESTIDLDQTEPMKKQRYDQRNENSEFVEPDANISKIYEASVTKKSGKEYLKDLLSQADGSKPASKETQSVGSQLNRTVASQRTSTFKEMTQSRNVNDIDLDDLKGFDF